MSTRLTVPSGTPVQLIVGIKSSPPQGFATGIAAPSANSATVMVSSAGAVVVAGAAAVVAGVAEVVAGAAVVGAATAVVPGWAASSLSLSPHAAANITRAKAIPGNLTYDEGTGRSAFLWVAPASQIIRTERFEDGTKHVNVRATNLVLAQLAAWIVNGAAAVAASRRGGSQARSEALHPSRRGH